jgi:hypothetical protein
MTKHCSTCGRIRTDFFFPTEAILSYTSRLASDPTVVTRRQKIIEFSQKLHAVLGPSVGPYYHLHEGLLVLTAAGLDGPGVQVDCVAITHIGVFVVSQVDWTGMVSSSLEKGKLRVTNAEGMTDLHPCPLRYTAPAVHFLGAVLDGLPDRKHRCVRQRNMRVCAWIVAIASQVKRITSFPSCEA